MIAGVSAGLAEYIHVDVTLIRVLFVLFSLWQGWGVGLYLICWAVIPSSGDRAETTAGDAIRVASQTAAQAVRSSRVHVSFIVGVTLIVLGVMTAVSQWWPRLQVHAAIVWPLLLVALGASFFRRN